MIANTDFEFSFIEGPPALAGHCHSLHVFRTEQSVIEDVMPSYSPQLILVREGRAAMQFADGRIGRSSGAFVVTQLDQAAPFRIEGPFETAGASLSALGWAATSGLPASEWKNRAVPVAEVFAPALAARIEAIAGNFHHGQLSARNAALALGEALAAELAPLPAGHRDFVTAMQDWLSGSFAPDLAAFQARTGYSPRQVQRLASRYFGAPPASLIKRFRAIRAATMLTLPALPSEIESEIFDAFYDQPHMIREIRHFTGRTPRRLADSEGGLAVETLALPGYGHSALATAIATADAHAVLEC